jgi:L-threonylcarbamoyladenylate synthase
VIGAADAEAFAECIRSGGVAVFPADTVYGLAAAPDSAAAVQRLYELKRRSGDSPAAVMFFSLPGARAVLDDLEPRTRAAAEKLLPGPVTLLLPNPSRRWPLACGPEPERLGLRVPALAPSLAALAEVDVSVLQSSANLHGGADACLPADVDESIRAGADLFLDGGELPGTPSSVLDLTAYEASGEYEVVRAGALPAADVDELLR